MKKLVIIQCLLIFTQLISSISAKAQSDGKCRALAMRGGGTKGAYEVGALKAIISELDPIEYQYDVVVGVSIGAINAAIFALHPPGDEKKALKELVELWETYKSQDMWRVWPGSNLLGGIWKDAFLDSTPLANMIKAMLENRPFLRKFAYLATEMSTGRVVLFDEDVPEEFRAKSLLASASLPGFFSPVDINGLSLNDGGVFENLDLASAIIKCKEQGAKDEDIIIDILLCFDTPQIMETWTYTDAKFKTSKDLYERKNRLKDYYHYKEDVERVMRGYPHTKFRYISQPTKALPTNFIPIFSTQDQMQFQMDLGESDMRNIIKSNKLSNILHLEVLLQERHKVSSKK